ncbi:MAG: thiamine pyrophosphate-dependent enzyme [Saprospiraceae bacterium]|jgi:pyruvate/2-oxoglutarate/acetoin dehydrogenase E1 component/TPP-dependent pyruvate/acetoin dehydrogenase alpha subunit|nr:transketolase [Saprospiraceae bacterium]
MKPYENLSIANDQDVLQNEESFKKNVLHDFWVCQVSREASLVGRKEVLNGRGKFGIYGDGKEVPQVAMARAFRKGDWRSGYYRDQTFMFALGISTVEQYFAQLYADPERDPFSSGRQMNNHYATRLIDEEGDWLDHTQSYNVSSDISCTAGQMARALGLAMASKKYRKLDIPSHKNFSDHGNEVSFVTIGDSSTSEGIFWETMNAAAVMRVPLLVAVWDDGYGISVPVEMQTTKGSISKALEGFLPDGNGNGIMIYTVKGWDYPELCAVFEKVTMKVREKHMPALIHVQELTQPQGHSTSGSHERYKTPSRLTWEKEHDCIKKMEEWMLLNGIASEEEIAAIKIQAVEYAKSSKDTAWNNYSSDLKQQHDIYSEIWKSIPENLKTESIKTLENEIKNVSYPAYSDLVANGRKLQFQLTRFGHYRNESLDNFVSKGRTIGAERYNTHLYSDTKYSALEVAQILPKFGIEPKLVNGFKILNSYFDQLLEFKPNIVAFGEDVGHIGDVNQGFAGLQNKHGNERVFDTGIREWSIMGQAVGGAMRGLRPIAEIQYVDYMAYAFSVLTDDLATLRYRTAGIQRAPAIVRTRGHRLEGIWHAGSPMGMILTSMKGIYLCVPRNMVQAVGFYNTLLKSDDPGIVVECLNGYRLKEKMPENLLEFTMPLGKPEVLQKGTDITLVTYGSCVRVAEKAIDILKTLNISVELIDIQTLMPFDLEGIIVDSIKKTNRVVFLDEDIPGGATAFMMREVLEKWNGYKYLDSKPITITAAPHRTPYGTDGDYFSKPNPEDIVEIIHDMIQEVHP